MSKVQEREMIRGAGDATARPAPGATGDGAARAQAWGGLLPGAVGGLLATLPMTVAMKLLQRGNAATRPPFPPHEVAMGVAETAGIERHEMSEERRRALTYAGHFGYGAAVGAAYPLLTRPLPGPAAARGAAYGLAVWAGSYLGFLPAFRLWGPPAHQAASPRAARTTVLLVLAHLVWGAALGLVHEALASRLGARAGRADT